MFLDSDAGTGGIPTGTSHPETPKGRCPHGHDRHPDCSCYQHDDPAHAPDECVRALFEANPPERVVGQP